MLISAALMLSSILRLVVQKNTLTGKHNANFLEHSSTAIFFLGLLKRYYQISLEKTLEKTHLKRSCKYGILSSSEPGSEHKAPEAGGVQLGCHACRVAAGGRLGM